MKNKITIQHSKSTIKKKFSSCILLFAVFANCFSQTPNYLWAKSASGTSSDYGQSCSADASGNIIATGYFTSSSITLGTTTLTNAGSAGTYDMFIVKYDPSGNVLWAKSEGGTSGDGAYSCTTDASGNIIATGFFSSSSISLGTTTLTNAGSVGTNDIFIVKYDPNGNVLWAKSAGGTFADIGYSCCTDASGNIIATGYFYSPSITIGTTTLSNAGSADIFIVKYGPNGNVLWAKSEGGTSIDIGYSCDTDASGNIIATGYFQSPSITIGTSTLTNAGSDDIFIVKYDPNGNVLWAKSEGGTGSDYSQSCSADASGNIVATGSFQSPSISLGTTTLTTAGNADIFIVKYDPSGNVLWAKSEGGTGNDYSLSCSADASGNIIVTGIFQSSSIALGTNTLTNAGGSSPDIFIVKYNPSGNVLWAKSAGGTGWDYGLSCGVDASGNIIVTGYFQSPSLTFGTTTLTNTSAGTYDFFIAKLGSATGIDELGAESWELGVYPNPSGNYFIIDMKNGLINNTMIIVYDVLGKEVKREKITGHKTIIQHSLQKGIYFYSILSETEKIASGKLLID